MLDILQFCFGHGRLGCVPEDVIVEISLVVNLVEELIHAWRRLSTAAPERLRADNLAIVDDQLLTERGWRCQ